MKKISMLICLAFFAIAFTSCAQEITDETTEANIIGTTEATTEETSEETTTEETTESTTEPTEETTETSETTAETTPAPTIPDSQPYIDVIDAYVAGHEGDYINYDLIDVNGDEYPELVIYNEHKGDEDDWTLNLYTYDGNEMKTVINEYVCDHFGNIGFVYVPGEDYICNHYSAEDDFMDFILDVYTLEDFMNKEEPLSTGYYDYDEETYTVDSEKTSMDGFFALMGGNSCCRMFGFHPYEEIMEYLNNGVLPAPTA